MPLRRSARGAEGQDDRIAERDRMDSARAIAPLMPAADAMIIDSTFLTPEEVANRIIAACTNPTSSPV
jgi:CMP/dCMP kinase